MNDAKDSSEETKERLQHEADRVRREGLPVPRTDERVKDGTCDAATLAAIGREDPELVRARERLNERHFVKPREFSEEDVQEARQRVRQMREAVEK